jgi:hypothetical protein
MKSTNEKEGNGKENSNAASGKFVRISKAFSQKEAETLYLFFF